MKKGKTKCPSKACVCAILTVWQFTSIIAIIVCGVLFLKPYLRISRYRPTMCRVESSFYTNQFLCTCGRSCEPGKSKSLYPCLIVHVSHNVSDGEMPTVTLYADDLHQANVFENKYDGGQQCSVHHCETEMVNRKYVDDFHQQYGQRGVIFPCWYDPGSTDWGVVIRVRLEGIKVLHAMVWPTFCLALGSLICVVFCKKCRKYTLKEKEKEESAKDGEEKEKLKPDCDTKDVGIEDKNTPSMPPGGKPWSLPSTDATTKLWPMPTRDANKDRKETVKGRFLKKPHKAKVGEVKEESETTTWL